MPSSSGAATSSRIFLRASGLCLLDHYAIFPDHYAIIMENNAP